jgi:hypothetical protein
VLDFAQRNLSTTFTLRHGTAGILEAGAVGVNIMLRDLAVGGEEALTPDAGTRAAGLFLYEEVPLTAALQLQIGARAELQEIHARANNEYPDFDERRRTGTLSGSVGLNLRPIPGFEFGTQLARAFSCAPARGALRRRAASGCRRLRTR